MKMNLYCVLDRVANVCMVPFPATNHGAAIRGFGDGMQKNDTFKSHPQDYALLHLGSWDDNTGVITGVALPETISSGADWAVSPTLAGAPIQAIPQKQPHAVPARH